MNVIVPLTLSLLLGGVIVYQYEKDISENKKKEKFGSIIEARPDYKSTLTPRSDPYVSSGVIRGSPPSNMNQTAIQSYPITQERGRSESSVMNQQYGLSPYPVQSIPVNKPKPFLYAQPYENQSKFQPQNYEGSQMYMYAVPKSDRMKNNPPSKEHFLEKTEKIKLSSDTNNKMSQQFEQIDAPLDISSSQFSKLANMNEKPVAKESRPDLSYAGAQLPKLGIDNKFKDPTDPSNYMYDRTLFAPLKRRNGGNQTDFIRGDIYVAPNKFGWFDVPSNPGTDLNPGFFNLNYPSFEQSVEKQDVEIKRQNKALTLEELENIQKNNPFSTNFLHHM